MGVGGMDIETAVRYKVPVVYLVNCNGIAMTGSQKVWFENTKLFRTGTAWTFLPNIRYDKMFERQSLSNQQILEKVTSSLTDQMRSITETIITKTRPVSQPDSQTLLQPSQRLPKKDLKNDDDLKEEGDEKEEPENGLILEDEYQQLLIDTEQRIRGSKAKNLPSRLYIMLNSKRWLNVKMKSPQKY
jgi:hypothetical protein